MQWSHNVGKLIEVKMSAALVKGLNLTGVRVKDCSLDASPPMSPCSSSGKTSSPSRTAGDGYLRVPQVRQGGSPPREKFICTSYPELTGPEKTLIYRKVLQTVRANIPPSYGDVISPEILLQVLERAIAWEKSLKETEDEADEPVRSRFNKLPQFDSSRIPVSSALVPSAGASLSGSHQKPKPETSFSSTPSFPLIAPQQTDGEGAPLKEGAMKEPSVNRSANNRVSMFPSISRRNKEAQYDVDG